MHLPPWGTLGGSVTHARPLVRSWVAPTTNRSPLLRRVANLMPKLVLIVDDDPVQRRILEGTIKRLGYETRTAQGGEEALALLEDPDQAAIALVLLDLVMPGLDGMAVLRRAAHNPAAPPIIVQTANGSIDTAITAMRAG